MKKSTKFVFPIFGILLLLVNCSQSGPTITDDEVIVKTSSMDVHFSRGRSFGNTYMIFGGTEITHGNAFSKITLSGLDINTAKNIYSMYPDFHLCKSPGAPMAQRAVVDFDIVPANSKTMKNLRKTLKKYQASIHNGGDRVCVKLEGEVLRLTSVLVRELNKDITHELPPQVHHDYFLVTSAELHGFKEILEGKM
ncbi:MAG: hypothetical protein JSV33_05020 [bacterium]|nr:MAG: hypothetical protein JSV33_05020 [bacterium]